MYLVDDENRNTGRTALSIPVSVEVAGERASELGWLLDVSASGAGFRISRPIGEGQLVLLTSRIPKEYRLFDFGEAEYSVWSIVRRCIEVTDRSSDHHYSVGAAFIGKAPPADHSADPNALYELQDRKTTDKGFWKLSNTEVVSERGSSTIERRQQTRLQIAEPLVIELTTAAGPASEPETTVTENVTRYGASVLSQLGVKVGSFVRVRAVRKDKTLLAIVRNKHIGTNGMQRLHIEFIDDLFPLEGID